MTTNSYTNIFTGNPVWAANVSYVSYTLSGNLSLNWPTEFLDNGNVVGGFTAISTPQSGYSVSLPDATLASVGQSVTFINTSAGNFSFIVTDYANNTLITLNQGQSVVLLLTNTSTSQGAWLVFPFAQGMTAVTSVAATTTSSGLSIGGSPITSAGTLTFTLSSGLQAIANLNATGIIVQSATGPSLMTTVDIVGGTNIDVTNGDGTLGNPTINLSDTLTGISSAVIGSMTLSNNTIITSSGNVPIQITPNGTGSILLGAGVSPPTVSSTGNITNVGTLSATTINGGNLTLSSNVLSSSNTNGNINLNANGIGSIILESSSPYPFSIASTGLTSHPSIVNNWVIFSGTTGNIVNSYNIVSVLRTSTGNYTITLPSQTGLASILVSAADPTINAVVMVRSHQPTVIGLNAINLSGTSVDPTFIYFAYLDTGI